MKKMSVVSLDTEVGGRLVRVDGIIHYHIDYHYGADADGNRGYAKTIVDDVVDIMVNDADGDYVEVDAVERDSIAEQLIEKFLREG